MTVRANEFDDSTDRKSLRLFFLLFSQEAYQGLIYNHKNYN